MLSLNAIKIAAIGFSLALAGFTEATAYASFCDDTACSTNCGEAVSADNPGCLSESGRNSISIHGIDYQPVSLVFSPDSDCECQNDCIDEIVQQFVYMETCIDLTGHAIATGFRFIGGDCDANNCAG